MDKDLFEKKLKEVAEYIIPKTEQETSANAKKKRGRKSAEEQYQEQREAIFMEEFDGINLTKPFLITRLKVKSQVCDDCGRICEEGCRKEKKVYETGGRHWREKCVTCGLHKNPYTGEFNLNSREVSGVWAGWLRKLNPNYEPKKKKIEDEMARKERLLQKEIAKGRILQRPDGSIRMNPDYKADR